MLQINIRLLRFHRRSLQKFASRKARTRNGEKSPNSFLNIKYLDVYGNGKHSHLNYQTLKNVHPQRNFKTPLNMFFVWGN